MKLVLMLILATSLYAKNYQIDQSIPIHISKLLNQLSYENKDFQESEINNFLQSYFHHLEFLNDKLLVHILNKSYQMKDHSDFELSKETFNLAKDGLSKVSTKQPFTKYILESFVNDLGDILTERRFDSYTRQMKSSSNKISKEFKEIHKKVLIVRPWIKMLVINSDEQIQGNFQNLNLELLRKLNSVGSFLNKMTRIPITKRKQFVIKIDQDLEKAREEVKKLDFQLFPSKSKDYLPPESLPEPINDWKPKK